MPLYDYVCTEGHVVELRRAYDDDVIECPTCGHLAVRNPINQSQSVITETGAKNGRRAITPSDQVNLKPSYDLYREAAQELEYNKTTTNPSLAQRGVARAHQLQKQGVTVDDFRKRRTS